MERLQKILAQAGIASRRKAEELIINGQVEVNGQIIKELGVKVDPDQDEIKVDGVKVMIQTKKIVILLNKPVKVITSVSDPQGRKTVIDYIDIDERVYPVGRLDYDTEGLLLLTNDGELANRLMHPKYELDKTYEAVVKGIPTEKELDQLRQGIELEDGMTFPAEVNLIEKKGVQQAKIHITIHEGRNRQVRRMFQAIGFPVMKLKRIRYGFLTLQGISGGRYRLLKADEYCRLKKMVKMSCDE